MITKKSRTVVNTTHTYKISFNEFWNIVKDSKMLNKSVYYNPAYSPLANTDTVITVSLDKGNLLKYLKTIDIKGEIYLISCKGDDMEICSQEQEVIKK